MRKKNSRKDQDTAQELKNSSVAVFSRKTHHVNKRESPKFPNQNTARRRRKGAMTLECSSSIVSAPQPSLRLTPYTLLRQFSSVSPIGNMMILEFPSIRYSQWLLKLWIIELCFCLLKLCLLKLCLLKLCLLKFFPLKSLLLKLWLRLPLCPLELCLLFLDDPLDNLAIFAGFGLVMDMKINLPGSSSSPARPGC